MSSTSTVEPHVPTDVVVHDPKSPPPPFVYVWPSIVVFAVAHTMAMYACWLILTSASIYTTLFTCGLYWFCIVGLLVGCHRLWSHRSFTASPALEWFLMAGATMAYQNNVIHRVREHRAHHKSSGTMAIR